MSIFKKIGFFLLVLLFVAGAAYGYFYLRSIKKPAQDAFSQLPDSCIIYIKTTNFFELNRRINSRSLIADKMRAFESIDELCRILKRADSLFSANERLLEQLQDTELHFALYGKEKINWLASFNIRELGREEQILSTMAKHLTASPSGDYYKTQTVTGKDCFFTINSGVVAFSDSKIMLEKCFDALGSKFHDNPDFLKNKNTFSESNLISLYVDHPLFAASSANKFIDLGVLTQNGCSASAVETDPSSFTINGFYETDQTGIYKFLAHQEPQSVNKLIDQLPSGTTSFKAWGLSGLPSIIAAWPKDEILLNYWEEKNEIALYNAEKDFYENTGNYLIRFIAGGVEFLGVQVKDTLKADDAIKVLADSTFQEINGVRRLAFNDSTHISLFKMIEDLSTDYVIRYRDFLYFSHAAPPLSGLKAFVSEHATLRTRNSFMSYQSEHFADDFNLLLYNSPSSDPLQINSVIKFTRDTKHNPYENLKHLSFSLTNDDDRLRFRLHLLNESGGGQEDKGSLWTFIADTLLQGEPTVFINHNSKERELLCQDAANSLYLLNAKGNKIWKKKLPEKIISELRMVDAFKNNKLQILFNTRSHLYLIDRNGNNVEGFPKKLSAQTTAGLSLFDYDKNKEYRIVLPCGNIIYNFDITGAELKGFKPVGSANDVHLPVQYVQIGPNDYLVAMDSEGSILVFSRRGEIRLNLKNRAIAGCKAFYVDAGNNLQNSHVVYFDDKSAILNKISFADKKAIAKLDAEFNEEGTYSFSNIDENRLTDILITNGNTVSAYDLSGHRLLEKPFPVAIKNSGYYSDENRSILYCLSEEPGNLFLSDQATQKTTVLPATALPIIVDLFRDNKKYLVVANRRQLTCLPLN